MNSNELITAHLDTRNDLFHHCALIAFVEEAATQGGWPSSEATRLRAFALYEEMLQRKHQPKPDG